MYRTRNAKRIVAGALLSGVVAAACLSLSAGTAQADVRGPFQWCPGDPTGISGEPPADTVWDWNVCHTFYRVDVGLGNVQSGALTSAGRVYKYLNTVWDGDNPPAGVFQGN